MKTGNTSFLMKNDKLGNLLSICYMIMLWSIQEHWKVTELSFL